MSSSKRRLALVPVVVAAAVVVAGCGERKAASNASKATQVVQGQVVLATPAVLPKDAKVTVAISQTNGPSKPPVASQVITPNGAKQPYAYQIMYKQEALVIPNTYGLTATITSGGKTTWKTKAPVSIPTTGNPQPGYQLIVYKVG